MPASSPAESANLPRAVLLVDDSDDDRYFLQRLLKKAEIAHPVLPFEDGKSVIEFLSTRPAGGAPPAAMFLDLSMPRMNGHEVLAWVRQQSWLKRMRVIVLSGSTLYADIKRAAELGADYYFEKFPSAETLRQLVDGEAVTRSGALAQACAGR